MHPSSDVACPPYLNGVLPVLNDRICSPLRLYLLSIYTPFFQLHPDYTHTSSISISSLPSTPDLLLRLRQLSYTKAGHRTISQALGRALEGAGARLEGLRRLPSNREATSRQSPRRRTRVSSPRSRTRPRACQHSVVVSTSRASCRNGSEDRLSTQRYHPLRPLTSVRDEGEPYLLTSPLLIYHFSLSFPR